MRAAFGLVGLLVGFGVLMLVWSSYNIPVAREGKKAQDQAKAVAGYEQDGTAIRDSIKLEGQSRPDGKLAGVVVKSITPGSVMETHYGLRAGDLVIQVGPLPVDDESMGIARVQEAYQRQDSIIILRNGTKYTMPDDSHVANAATPGAAPAAGVTPAPTAADGSQQPAPAPEEKKTSLQRQLDAIKVPTH